LSEDTITAAYETGQQGMAIRNHDTLDLLAPAPVDLDRLMTATDPETAVQAIAPQPLYQALMTRGPEDCLELLPYLSREQFVRIFDYDVWTDDKLAPAKALRWLNLYRNLGPEQLYRRFRELDEEYQLALLGPHIEWLDLEEFEALPDSEQDFYNRMPCGTAYYRIKAGDAAIDDMVASLVDAALGQDIDYAYSMLTHAAYLPPGEQEALIGQFRRARLEEDGFVTYEESLSSFRPIDVVALAAKWRQSDSDASRLMVPARPNDELFLVRVMQRAASQLSPGDYAALNQGCAMLGNTLAASARIDTDDLEGLRRLLKHAQSLVSLGLEYLAAGDEVRAVDVLKTEHPQVLFRSGLSLVGRLQEALSERFVSAGLPGAAECVRYLRMDRRGMLIHGIDQKIGPVLGMQRTEMLKGIFNRFPLVPESTPTGGRITFAPVASLASLVEVARVADGISGVLYLAQLTTPPGIAVVDIDRHLLTAMAQVLLGRAFSYAPLSPADEAALSGLPTDAVQSLTADFFAGAEGSLRVALMQDKARTWAVSRVLGIATKDPVLAAMNELSDLVMQLVAAREGGRLSGVLDVKADGEGQQA
jgi:hypothetical protein